MHGIDWSTSGHWVPIFGYVAMGLFAWLAFWVVWRIFIHSRPESLDGKD
jgi:hypothetical protein